MRDVIASLFEVGIDPMFVIRCEDSASDRGRHAELTVLRLGRLALSVERSTTDIAPGCDGAGLRFARNPGVGKSTRLGLAEKEGRGTGRGGRRPVRRPRSAASANHFIRLR